MTVVRVCSIAVIHAGECPIMADDAGFGLCAELCDHDGSCNATQKCCSNGCGHTCTEAVQPGTENLSLQQIIVTNYDGHMSGMD